MSKKKSPNPGNDEKKMMEYLQKISSREFMNELERLKRLEGQSGSGPSASRSRSKSKISKSLEALSKGEDPPRGLWKRIYKNISDRSLMITSIIVFMFIVTLFVSRYNTFLSLNGIKHDSSSLAQFNMSTKDYTINSFSSLLKISVSKSKELWTSLNEGVFQKIGLIIGTSKEVGMKMLNSLFNLKNFIMSYMPNTETFASFGRRMKMSFSGVKNWIFGIPVQDRVYEYPITVNPRLALPPAITQTTDPTKLDVVAGLKDNLRYFEKRQLHNEIDPKSIPNFLHDPQEIKGIINGIQNEITKILYS